MTKQEFLRALWNKLSALPSEDVGRALDYFSEMIDDRMENGLTEEEAVAAVSLLQPPMPASKVSIRKMKKILFVMCVLIILFRRFLRETEAEISDPVRIGL